MASYNTTKYLEFIGTDSGGTLSWGSITNHAPGTLNVVDNNGDGNLDINTDYFTYPSLPFTGYYIVHGGQKFGIYVDLSNPAPYLYYIPHNGELDGYPITAGSTTLYSDNLVDAIVCFLAGTLIATPNGPAAIEELKIGDSINTASPSGQTSTAPVKFLFKQTIDVHPFLPQYGIFPIHICAGAFGNGLPQRDLFVSPDHAMLVDGCLVHAAALINHRTVVQRTDWKETLVYYHIETEKHELILAEGAPTETFIDNVSREKFDNYREYQALYPDRLSMDESDLPRVKFKRHLPMVIQRRLHAVADRLLGKEEMAA